MNRKAPESRNTNGHPDIIDLKKRLDGALHTEERIGILLELSRRLRRKVPSEALDYALSALQLAQTLSQSLLTANALFEIGHTMATVGDYQSALDHLSDAHRLFHRMRNEQREYETLHLMAVTYMQLGKNDRGEKILNRNLRYFQREKKMLWIVRTLNSLGSIYKSQSDYVAAFKAFHEAIELAKQNGFSDELSRLYIQVAPIYREAGDLDNAILSLQQGLELYDQMEDRLGSAIAHMNLGAAYVRQENFAVGMKHLLHALRAFRRLGQTGREGNAWSGLGAAYVRQGKLKRGEHCYLKALEVVKMSGSTYFTISIYRNLANLSEANEKFIQGIAYAKKGLEVATKWGEKQWELESLHDLSILYEKTGNISEALRYTLLYQEMREQIYAPEKINEVVQMTLHTRIEKLRTEIQMKEELLQKLQKAIERKDMALSTLALQLLQQQSKAEKEAKNYTTPEGEESNWGALIGQISKVDRLFYQQLARAYPHLTTAELKVCTLIRIGLISKEMAQVLNVSVRTIEAHRANIRKKLRLSSKKKTLNAFIASQ